jgi:uncharacterized phage-like protein YoqJ
MKIAATGHRPPKVCTWEEYESVGLPRMVELARNCLIRLEAEEAISGMALGWDIAFALAAINLNIPLIAAIPFEGQEKRWKRKDQLLFHDTVRQSQEIVYVCKEKIPASTEWSKQKIDEMMKARDHYMVDRCDKVLALYNGTSGGTSATVKYAESQGKPVINVWNSWVKYRGF